MNERKPFSKIPESENNLCSENGRVIFEYLKENFPGEDAKDYDCMLNSLLASLLILTRSCVAKDNHRNFIQLIYKILTDNLA